MSKIAMLKSILVVYLVRLQLKSSHKSNLPISVRQHYAYRTMQSVCLSVTGVDWVSQKQLELGLCNFHRAVAHLLVFAGKVHP